MSQWGGGGSTEPPVRQRCGEQKEGLTLNRLGFLQIDMAGGGQILLPLCNFCLNGPIDRKLGM